MYRLSRYYHEKGSYKRSYENIGFFETYMETLEYLEEIRDAPEYRFGKFEIVFINEPKNID